MQNTFINQSQNPNKINQENPTIQRKYQPNQPYIQNGMNSPLYNSSSQNLNTPYNNTIPNQAILPGQPNPYQNSSYMNSYQQNQGIPLYNFPGQTGGMFIQPQSQVNINYENIKNIGEIPHLLFTQPDDNTFLISSKLILIPAIIMTFMTIPFFIIPIVVGEPMMFIMYIGACVPIITAICICMHAETSIYFILGQNNITVNKNTVCKKKSLVYNSGELLRVEYQQNFRNSTKGLQIVYEIVFVTTKGAEKMTSVYNSSAFTNEEIGYFLHVVNKHIQTKMCPK